MTVKADARQERRELKIHHLTLQQQERRKEQSLTSRPVKRKRKKSSLRWRIYRLYRINRYLRRRRHILRNQRKAKQKWDRLAESMERKEIKERLTEKRLTELSLEMRKHEIERSERRQQRKNRWRLIRQLLRSRMRSIFHELRTFDKYSIKRWTAGVLAFAENKDKRNSFFMITFNSTVMFIFSYLVIYIIGQTATVITALTFKYKVILFYFKVYYNIDSSLWTADSVKIIYSAKPVIGLITAIVFMILYSTRRDSLKNSKVFYLWGTVHGSVMFFGSLLMGTMLNKDFGWVIAYMYYRDTGKMVYSIISIFGLVTIGGFLARSFLFSGNSYFNFITRSENKYFVACQVIWPTLIGTFLQILASLPNNEYFMPDDEVIYKILKLLTVFVLIIPLIISFRSINEVFFDEEPRKIRLDWKFLLITVVLIITMRLSLQNGLPLG
jgi:hypothetical protein